MQAQGKADEREERRKARFPAEPALGHMANSYVTVICTADGALSGSCGLEERAISYIRILERRVLERLFLIFIK